MMCSKFRDTLLIICIFISVISAQDSNVLRGLKDDWKNTPPSWEDGSDPCGGSWDGISCTNGRVTRITLASMQLMGDLSGHIWQFTEVQILDLSYNKELFGSLPSEVGNMRKLTELTLVGCGFTGPIPDTIGNLTSLVSLSLNSNSFTGSIPASIGKLKNLCWLDLTGNKLTGSIPVSTQTTPGLDMLTNAKHFHFGDNQLSGEIPPGLFNSNMKLIHLLLHNNRLRGPIPSTLGLVTSLEVVRLDRNYLCGNVPPSINNLINTTGMFLSNNHLTGSIPDLTGMNLLNYVDLSNNTFDLFTAPSWFSTLLNLTTIKMHNTNLGGVLPPALFQIPQLQHVDLSYNRINGTLDINPKHSTQLQLVDLRHNQIDGFVQRNQYEDSIGLILADNLICIESDVTYQFCSPNTNATTYSTSLNHCTPHPCESNLGLSPNCECTYPYRVSIFFKAPSFSSLENSTIYISLHDSLMSLFHDASLPVDSLSLNNPRRNVDDYLVIDLEIFPSGETRFNRTGILGLVFALSPQTFNPPPGFNIYYFIPEIYDFLSGTRHKSSNTRIIVGFAVGGFALVVLLVLTGIYYFHQKEGAERARQQSQPFARWDSTSGSGGVPQLKGARSFTFEELRKYTSNFSENNNIGKGGYGMVYKGSLPNGQLIAIKRAQEGSSQGMLEFKNELEILSRVHHKNVVGLIGFCFDKGEQMLVYEYIVNGTLKDSLSGRSGIRLDWMRRLKIALGAARGLQYLHDHADPPIIHRDVKTNNILLDERLVAKVADFGLSKTLSDTTITHGYMDPEYYLTQQLTEKSDTYSFGIVMLEIITARNPIEKGKYIVTEVQETMNKSKELYDLKKVLDPTIGISTQLNGLERFVDLALRCVEEMGSERPSMSEVVKELESIMELIGLNQSIELSSSVSATYKGTSNDYNKSYSNDSFLSHGEDSLPSKLYPSLQSLFFQ